MFLGVKTIRENLKCQAKFSNKLKKYNMTTEDLKKMMEAYGRAVLVHFNFKIKILDFAYACNNISRYLVEKGRIQKVSKNKL
jgi:hypothetical protein